jgi:maltooligosyltrehalose trehalohydrolase
VREWVCQSAERWIRDFGFDGLRLDAIHAIFDQSPEHIVAEVARRAHAVDRHAVVIAESGLNDPKVIRPPSNGGYGCDASWADDFHHALRTLLTDDRDGYYGEYGQLELLAQAFKRPYVYAGRYSPFRDKVVGAPADDVEPERFVVFCQNHDQVGNRAFGDRLPDEARRLAAFCTLLSPFTPMLFMGEEYGEQAPFQFFSDHIDERIAEATRQGRRKEFSAFASFGHEIPDPQDPATFAASKLTRQGDPELAELYRQLLQIRPQLPREAAVASLEPETDATLSVLRGDYQLLCNFGSQPVQLTPIGDRMMLTTHPDSTELKQGKLTLPPLAGALISR